MYITAGEKIKIMLKRKGRTLGFLADTLGQSRQNMSNKMSRDNFTEKELLQIAEALDCQIEITFTDNDTGERI